MYKENGSEERHKVFGIAADYYRARVLTVQEELPADLEWRDDVLYREPKTYAGKLKTTYRIQVLQQDSSVIELANLREKSEAKRRYKELKEDLGELTKMKFDEKYGIKDTSTGQLALYRKEIDKDLLLDNAIYFTGLTRSRDGDRSQ